MIRWIISFLISINLLSVAVYAEEVATQSEIITYNTNKNTASGIIISKNITENGTSEIQNTLKPENAVKISKQDLLTLIFSKLYWCSWTWINHGSYYGVSTSPWSTLDGMSVCINYKMEQFPRDLIMQKQEVIAKTLFDRAISDLTNKVFLEEYYYIAYEPNGELSIYTENLTGRKSMFENNYPE